MKSPIVLGAKGECGVHKGMVNSDKWKCPLSKLLLNLSDAEHNLLLFNGNVLTANALLSSILYSICPKIIKYSSSGMNYAVNTAFVPLQDASNALKKSLDDLIT